MLTPLILSLRFPIHFILHPALFKKLTKSFISGSIAQFFKMVVPFAKLAAIIKFSVATTDILGKYIFEPIKASTASTFEKFGFFYC